MTGELRPAEKVAIRVRRAWEAAISCGPEESANQAAAAVIEADREAVRAEQAAELAKFKALAETLAGAVKVLMPTTINLRMPHPDDSFIVPLDVSMGELRALDAALRQYKEATNV